MDPRIVEIFDRWGFVWGGRWSTPDGMHFELGALLRETRAAFEKVGLPDAAREARILVEELTGTSRTDSIATPDLPIEPAKWQAVEDAVWRRIRGEPVHRILGRREFYGLDLLLSPTTLEPRPDRLQGVPDRGPRVGYGAHQVHLALVVGFWVEEPQCGLQLAVGPCESENVPSTHFGEWGKAQLRCLGLLLL
jgi:hypothetical protein